MFRRKRQVLFIQGGGEGAHDEWDVRLADDLQRRLGEEFDVRYPLMPAEADPSSANWGPAIRREIADLDEGAVVVGHSVGATILIHTLAEQPPGHDLAAIVLIAAPFVGEGGWPSDEITTRTDLGVDLPQGLPVFLYHGEVDTIVPFSHVDLYAEAIPQAQVRRLPGRDHQINNDLTQVADDIRRTCAGS